MDKKIILTKNQIENTIKRLSFEIIEKNLYTKKIYLIGLEKNGHIMAKRIEKIISKYSKIELETIQLKSINQSFKLSKKINPEKRTIILIDDVLKSGKTIIYAIKFLLDYDIEKLRTLVLIDRSHNNFPVGLDFVGIKLSTTLEEHITVKLGEQEAAYLN